MILDINSKTEYNYLKHKSDFNKIVKNTINILNIKDNIEISVVFVDDQEIKFINYQYRDKNKITDVISFAFEDEPNSIIMNDDNRLLGDIIIAPNYCIKKAASLGHSERREIAFVFVHGLLHLLGFDHILPNDWDQMVAYERQILDKSQIFK